MVGCGMTREQVALVVLALGVGVTGCRRGEVREGPRAAPAKAGVASEAEALDLSPGVPRKPNRFAGDPLWERAAGGGEIDLLRLAQREGAAGLLEGVAVGRSVALTGLAALPHAEDAELALERLCELLESRAKRPGGPELGLLESVHGIVARPPRQREMMARQGYVECLPVTRKLAQARELDPRKRDLASSAAELLVEHREAGRR